MSGDPELQTRGRLVRSLGALREMLPGSFIERRRKCGKPYCRCADGKPEHMHPEFLLHARWEGMRKTFHIPTPLADQARRQVELYKRFQRVAEAIGQINLRRLLRHKQESQGRKKGK
jgi:hypothetical protein